MVDRRTAMVAVFLFYLGYGITRPGRWRRNLRGPSEAWIEKPHAVCVASLSIIALDVDPLSRPWTSCHTKPLRVVAATIMNMAAFKVNYMKGSRRRSAREVFGVVFLILLGEKPIKSLTWWFDSISVSRNCKCAPNVGLLSTSLVLLLYKLKSLLRVPALSTVFPNPSIEWTVLFGLHRRPL